MSDQLKMESRKSGGPVECLGMTFESEDARRYHFLGLLAEKLKDPAFRTQEGFPTGTDEAILAMSDPPYYTACPNPWLAEFVEHFGKAYDPTVKYSREPFTADVTEGKNDPIYNAHGYHTKVPHKAIMRYVLHYTKPGDLIMDAFCGTGMTGVAAQLCGDAKAVQSLGYRISSDGAVLQSSVTENGSEWVPFSKLGVRHAILGDLSPAATFISNNYNTHRDPIDLEVKSREALKRLHAEFDWMFLTLHNPKPEHLSEAEEFLTAQATPDLTKIGQTGSINYTVWSDVFTCPNCAGEIIFWNSAVDIDNGKVRDSFSCPSCKKSDLEKRGLDHAMETVFDHALGTIITQAKIAPVRINYTVGTKRFDKVPDKVDIAMCKLIEGRALSGKFPVSRLIDGQETRRNDPIGVTHVHHFYTRRNLTVFSSAFQEFPSELKWAVTGSIQRGSKQHQIAITRVGGEKAGEGGATAGHRRGTLYIPSNQIEMNPIVLLQDRISAMKKAALGRRSGRPIITTQSTTALHLPDNSLDYLFFDPPFGANINYSELNSLMEGWLGVMTSRDHEAIEDKRQKKDVNAYRDLMARCFRQAYRVLKPGRWMTVEFSNTQAAIWNAIQAALQEAGFVVANVSVLDKKRGGVNAIVGVTAVKQDLVISAYKPNGGLEERFTKNLNKEESVWDFVRTHLGYLPVVKVRAGELDFINERDPRIIFDRMVAWFIRHDAQVPLSSAEFQERLRFLFPERDGMIFLSEQVAEYERRRAQVAQAPQMEMFVVDERSAIDWLADFLKKRPSTYQDLQPEFMTQLGAGWKKHEARPELSALLEDNFLRYDGSADVPSQIHNYLSTNYHDLRNLEKSDTRLKAKAKDRWFVPDPNKAQDLEKKREKALLKEFEEYRNTPGRKLKEFRLEVLRAGFKAAWANKDYQTIVSIANKVPEDALQEDEKLLFWYDSALTRTGG